MGLIRTLEAGCVFVQDAFNPKSTACKAKVVISFDVYSMEGVVVPT